MLSSYLKNDEKILYFRIYKGEKYSKKDIMFFIIGILFAIISFVSLILDFIFSFTILIPCIISGLVSFGLIYYYLKLNKLHFTENDNINIEYILTNNRFLYVDLKNPNDILEIPFTSFTSSKVRVNYELNCTTLAIKLNVFPISTRVHNDVIEISNQEIVIQEVSNSFLLKNTVNFLIYLIQNNIDDINNTDKFLNSDENILYSETPHNIPFYGSKTQLFLKYGWLLFVVINFWGWFINSYFVSYIAYLFLLFWGAFFFKNYRNISIMKSKKKNNIFSISNQHNLKYVITNKRILFFDLDIPILYAFKLNDIDYVSINNYDKNTDIGDIYLCTSKYSKYIESLVNSYSHHKPVNQFEYFFPLNYSSHLISHDFDVMNCWKIRLYRVKNPNSIIDNFINKHINTKNKNTK